MTDQSDWRSLTTGYQSADSAFSARQTDSEVSRSPAAEVEEKVEEEMEVESW